MRNKFEFHLKIPHKKYISKNKQCLWEWVAQMMMVMGGGAIEEVEEEKELSRFPHQIVIVANSISANQSATQPSWSQLVNHHELSVCILSIHSMYISMCKRVFLYHHSHK